MTRNIWQEKLASRTASEMCSTGNYWQEVQETEGSTGRSYLPVFLICFFDIELCGKQIKPNTLLSVTVQSVSLHFTVSCPQKTSRVEREEDAMVAHFLLEKDEEEPEFQKIFVNKVRKSWNI